MCFLKMNILALVTPSKSTFRQYLAAIAGTIAVIMAGNAIGWPSPTLRLLVSDMSPVPMTSSDTSWMVAVLYLGNVISPLPCGKVMEVIGRRKTLLYMNIIPVASWLLIILTRNVYTVFIARFLAGLWLGIVYTVVPIYLVEISETRTRGSLAAMFGTMTYVGVLYEYVIGPNVSYVVLGVLSLAVCVIFLFSFINIPETPYFYVKAGEMEKARASLSWLRGDNPDINEELTIIQTSVEQQMRNKGKMTELFTNPSYRKALFNVGMLCIFQRSSGIGAIISYSSIALPKDAMTGVGRDGCVIILGTVWVVSTFIASFIVDKVGRKPLLIISEIGCSVSNFVAGLWLYLDEKTMLDVTDYNWIPFVCFVVHGFSYSIGLNPIVTTIKAEMFPANIKGFASGVTTVLLALSSTILNKSFQMFADNIGLYFNYILYSICSLLAVFFTLFFLIETKGKSLQEIQDELNGVRCDNQATGA